MLLRETLNEDTSFSTDDRRVPKADLPGGDLSNCVELDNSHGRTD